MHLFLVFTLLLYVENVSFLLHIIDNISLSHYNLTCGLSVKVASWMMFFLPPPLILNLISFFVCFFKLLQTRLGHLFGSTWFNHKCKARMLLEIEVFQM